MFGADTNNNTELHKLISSPNAKFNVINKFITNNVKLATKMARTHNHQGCLTYDLIDKSVLTPQEKQKLKNIFIKLYTQRPYKSLSQYLTPDKILKKYNIKRDSELYHNIILGYQLANEARQNITKSSTHPETNSYAFEEKYQLNLLIGNQRSTHSKLLYTFNNLYKLLTHPIDTIHAVAAESCLESHAGNCVDFAMFVDYLLKKNPATKNIPTELWDEYKGDHTVLVLYPDDPNNAVVVDAWGGKCFPLFALEKEFRCYARILLRDDDYINITTIYNPRVHYAHPMYGNQKKSKEMLKLAVCGLFAAISIVATTALLYSKMEEDHAPGPRM